MKSVQRGDIFWSNALSESGVRKKRMVLIIQNDRGNRFSEYVIAVPIRHESKKELPICVSIREGIAGVRKDSLIDCGHIGTFLKSKLEDYVGHLPDLQMHQVNKALKISLQLP